MAASTRVYRHLRRNVYGLVAIFIALSASAIALPGRNTVDTGDVVNETLKSKDIRAGEIRATDIGADAVGSAQVAGLAVTEPKLADAAVTIPKLAFDPATQAELGTHATSADHDGRYLTESELSSSDGNGPNSGSNFVDWNILNGVPAGFADGVDDGDSYLAGDGLQLSGTTFRVMPCANGQILKFGGSNWGCAADADTNSGGTVTSVGSGTGLTGGPITTSGALDIAGSYRLPQSCAGGDVPKSNGGGGWNCAPDIDTDTNSGGTVTQVNTGTGLAGGPITTIGSVDLLQGYRLPQGCASGEVAKSNGSTTWTCASDIDTTGNDWRLAGNAGTTSSDFLGTTDNQPLDIRVNNQRALRLEPGLISPNVIAGFSGNNSGSGVSGAAIGGGGEAGQVNSVTDEYGTVAGGRFNRAGNNAGGPTDTPFGTVGGGANNTAGGIRSTVAGGVANVASGSDAVIGGGDSNAASGFRTAIGGGGLNSASGGRATVAGGEGNQANGAFSAIPGGGANTASGDYSFVAGRQARNLNASHTGVFMFADSTPANFISAAANEFAVRASGGARLFSSGDTDSDAPGLRLPANGTGWSTLGNNPFDVVVNGARGLRIAPAFNGTNQSPNVIGGIADNSVAVGVTAATIAGGGESNPGNPATANKVTASYGTVGGGANNTASGSAAATVGGGAANTASGPVATVSGGQLSVASGSFATVGGGDSNTASGIGSTIPGGRENIAAGDYSMAAGRRAKNTDVNHDGVFLFADSTNADFNSSAANEFAVRSTGGARVVTAVDGTGTPTAGVKLDPGDTAWEVLSDRRSKENVEQVAPGAILDRLKSVPIREWSYKAQDPSIRHIGPMAQDFHRAFGLSGNDRTHLSPIDTDGVALAAIKGLDRRMSALRDRVEGGAAASAGGSGSGAVPAWAFLAAMVAVLAFGALGYGLGRGVRVRAVTA